VTWIITLRIEFKTGSWSEVSISSFSRLSISNWCITSITSITIPLISITGITIPLISVTGITIPLISITGITIPLIISIPSIVIPLIAIPTIIPLTFDMSWFTSWIPFVYFFTMITRNTACFAFEINTIIINLYI